VKRFRFYESLLDRYAGRAFIDGTERNSSASSRGRIWPRFFAASSAEIDSKRQKFTLALMGSDYYRFTGGNIPTSGNGS
jgi:hypothetical protein